LNRVRWQHAVYTGTPCGGMEQGVAANCRSRALGIDGTPSAGE
jgi:hypothetical protein